MNDDVIRLVSWIALGVPGLTLAMKLILSFPPIAWRLAKLRGR